MSETRRRTTELMLNGMAATLANGKPEEVMKARVRNLMTAYDASTELAERLGLKAEDFAMTKEVRDYLREDFGEKTSAGVDEEASFVFFETREADGDGYLYGIGTAIKRKTKDSGENEATVVAVPLRFGPDGWMEALKGDGWVEVDDFLDGLKD